MVLERQINMPDIITDAQLVQGPPFPTALRRALFDAGEDSLIASMAQFSGVHTSLSYDNSFPGALGCASYTQESAETPKNRSQPTRNDRAAHIFGKPATHIILEVMPYVFVDDKC